ncbi:MAG: AzlD domain-containing protein [Rhodospirillales bacterium]|jgi:branched-subunit amino acid transport protein
MLDQAMTEYWPWLLALVAGLATLKWRVLGVYFSGQIETTSLVFDWVSCVAYALIAGLVTRMIILPIGTLQETPPEARLLGAAIALVIFFAARRSVLLGTFAGVGLFVAMAWQT